MKGVCVWWRELIQKIIDCSNTKIWLTVREVDADNCSSVEVGRWVQHSTKSLVVGDFITQSLLG